MKIEITATGGQNGLDRASAVMPDLFGHPRCNNRRIPTCRFLSACSL